MQSMQSAKGMLVSAVTFGGSGISGGAEETMTPSASSPSSALQKVAWSRLLRPIRQK